MNSQMLFKEGDVVEFTHGKDDPYSSSIYDTFCNEGSFRVLTDIDLEALKAMYTASNKPRHGFNEREFVLYLVKNGKIVKTATTEVYLGNNDGHFERR